MADRKLTGDWTASDYNKYLSSGKSYIDNKDTGFYGHLHGGQRGNTVGNNPHKGIKHTNYLKSNKGVC